MMREKLPCVGLNRHADARIEKGHPWVFSNELADPKFFQSLDSGSLVDVLDRHGNYLGTGFINLKSLIAIRFLSRSREEIINQSFFEQKITAAVSRREAIYGKHSHAQSTYRAVYGEGDSLPGLVIDRFQGAWVIEPHSLGMAMRKELIISALEKIAKSLGENSPNIYYRTDHRASALEGIAPDSALILGRAGEAFAIEDQIQFPIDPLKGQKTGFFFDQRDNRSFFREWVAGASKEQSIKVLDLFCHAGAWGLRALKAGAEHAVFVDSSAAALASVEAAAKKMGFEKKIELHEMDVSDFLSNNKEKFSAISLDPPALIPNKKSLPQGMKHYAELHRLVIKSAATGALLASSSCSYHLQDDRFEEIVRKSLNDQNRFGCVLRRGGLSADHPFLPGMDEGRYLKNLSISI